jgi:hypothetical protein
MSVENRDSRPHPTVIVEVGPWREEIDEALAPLIRETWRAGIETMMCCQEVDPGIAWIEFESVEELYRFLNLVAHYEPGVDTLYNRIYDERVGPASAAAWQYQLNLMDIFEDQEEQTVYGLACFTATVGLCFPVTDIPVLLERLEALNNAS